MAEVGDQSDVEQAFALGWQVAELYHGPKFEGLPGIGAAQARLPGFSALSTSERALLLARQIGGAIAILLPTPRHPTTDPSTTHLESLMNTNPPDSASIHNEIWKQHIRIFEALNVRDFRLGKAYNLGRGLCETAIMPMAADDGGRDGMVRDLLQPGRCRTMVDWLSQLKSNFGPHAAYAVEGGLIRWSDWNAERTGALPADAAASLFAQGRIWRSLLTGEVVASDILQATAFVGAALALLTRIGQIARRFFLSWYGVFVVLVLVALAAGLYGISQASTLTTTNRLVAQIVAALAALGITAKGVLSSLGRALAKAERPLWESELDESCAIAATRLPQGVFIKRRRRADVGTIEWTGLGTFRNDRLSPRRLSARYRSRGSPTEQAHRRPEASPSTPPESVFAATGAEEVPPRPR